MDKGWVGRDGKGMNICSIHERITCTDFFFGGGPSAVLERGLGGCQIDEDMFLAVLALLGNGAKGQIRAWSICSAAR